MMLTDILQDVYALEDDMRDYEREYGVLSETFYESYMAGEEPPDSAWVLDWSDWAGAYKIWLHRREQYRATVQALRAEAPDLYRERAQISFPCSIHNASIPSTSSGQALSGAASFRCAVEGCGLLCPALRILRLRGGNSTATPLRMLR